MKNYKIYTTSEKAWDAMIEAIEQAKKSIYIEMYIFLDDTKKSHDFIGKLKQKARAGLRVIIVADSFGSKALKKEIAASLEKVGVEFLFFSSWLRHIHRKLLIIDEKTAFIGGVNIGKRFRHWNDIQMKIGGRIVKRILTSFAYTYEMAGGKDHKILKIRNKVFSSKLRFWLVEHWPNKNIYTLKSHYIEKISGAQKSIQIITPYFTPPRWLISLLDDAIHRGVKVDILVPRKVDWKIMNVVNYRYMRNLHVLGITFHLTKTMNHSKLLIIDKEEALIGSQNIDLFSFQLNCEVGIFFKEKEMVDELLEIFSKWQRNSISFKPQHYKMRFMDYVILALMKILHPIL